MAKFPEPPSVEELADCAPIVATLEDVPLWRIYSRGGDHPTTWGAFRHFGPTLSRFDHHEPPPSEQPRGILYASVEKFLPAFAEFFQETRTIDRGRRLPSIARFSLVEPVNLLDLTGLWPTQAGASMAINTGQKGRARRWSQTIYDAYPKLDGILYPSSMCGNAPLVALYERSKDALPHRPDFNRSLADPSIEALVKEVSLALNWPLV